MIEGSTRAARQAGIQQAAAETAANKAATPRYATGSRRETPNRSEARLGRWLLVTRDRVNSDSFQFTQEFLSHMLGTPRTVISIAACKLQDAGLIRYRRGRITILDRRALEAAACECYRTVLKEIGQIIAA